jgi:hypothetical protein
VRDDKVVGGVAALDETDAATPGGISLSLSTRTARASRRFAIRTSRYLATALPLRSGTATQVRCTHELMLITEWHCSTPQGLFITGDLIQRRGNAAYQ